ncbi:unnamed protein product [Blepharisma stoltei]|uniref:PH domain-containing protein n=1 Tax=Blepharisma stoltei TaxID=1481888 RepID=A0AAU9K0X4_9CILI|nr:unnamed protein product [Blepharisma stoltei]
MSKIVEKRSERVSEFYEDYAKKGSGIYKDTKSLQNQRYMWLEYSSGELRWSNHSITQSQFKRIALTHINKLTKIQHASSYGFQLETHHHTIKFWANSQEERDYWFIALNLALDKKENKPNKSLSSFSSLNLDENQKNPSKHTPASSIHNLSYFANKITEGSTPSPTSEQDYKYILNKLAAIIDPAIHDTSQSSLEELPQSIKIILSQNNLSLANIMNSKHQNPSLSAETTSLLQQVSVLQEKVTSLETIKQDYDTHMHTLQDLTNIYHDEKQLTEDFAETLERLHLEKNKASRDCRLFKTELDFMSERNNILEKRLQEAGFCDDSKKYVEIMKGVNGQVTKKGKEIEKMVSVSLEKDRLIFRPVDSFEIEREELPFSEITSITPTKKLENKAQAIIHNLNTPICISLPIEKAGIFTDILDLFNEYKKMQTESIENLIARQFKGNCDILESQLRFIEKRMKLYKSAIIGSIFDIKNSMSASQSLLEAEIFILGESVPKNMVGPVSEMCLQYINKERKEIIEKISQTNLMVALCNKDTDKGKENV